MFNYKWHIKDNYKVSGVNPHKLKVFSCFACGGGSTMGYKLAGYDVIGCNEIDPKMMKVYRTNHAPKHSFLESIQTFKLRSDLPKELFELDILDGSPPCSTFSMSGQREKTWGKKKRFREGQAKQVLSDLFFDFIDLAEKLKPKVVISENVKGLVSGNAKGYLVEIIKNFEKIGYNSQIFLLNSALMGVPQSRQRVFIISSRKDLKMPKLSLKFKEKTRTFKEIDEGIIKNYKPVSKSEVKLYNDCQKGYSIASIHPKGHHFNSIKLAYNRPVNTIASGSSLYHPKQKRKMSNKELILAGSFPMDYVFVDNNVQYIIGMSVPPLMIANIAHQLYLQWFTSCT
ncbi:MAG: DNA cytosine methyltransferase [Bacteroidetes bacterium]|nr:DNA cytosine methyltransferase [Bacteroidota bacterium]